MKRGTLDHPKLLELARLLDLEPWGAVGLLESLRHWASLYAKRGAIGRWSNEEIAEGIRWLARPADELIDAIVVAGWVDRVPDPAVRLVIRNWPRDRADLSSARWRALRLQVLAERGTRCAYCAADCADDPTIDHVQPVTVGGALFDLANLVVSCRPCNSRKGAREGWAH